MRRLRDQIEETLAQAQNPKDAFGPVYLSREQHMVVTKLEEALLWAKRAIEKGQE